MRANHILNLLGGGLKRRGWTPLRMIDSFLPARPGERGADNDLLRSRVLVGFCAIVVVVLVPIAIKDGVTLGLLGQGMLTTVGIILLLISCLLLLRIFRAETPAFFLLWIGGLGAYFYDLYQTGFLLSQAIVWAPVFVGAVAFYRGKIFVGVTVGLFLAFVWGGWGLTKAGVLAPVLPAAAKVLDVSTTIEPSLAILAAALLALFFRHARDHLQEELRQQNASLQMAGDALQANQIVLKTILESVPLGIAVKDADGSLLHVNQAFASIWHMEREAMAGMETSELAPAQPEELKLMVHTDREVVERGTDFDFTMIRTHADEESHLHVLKTPLRDPLGEIVGIVEVDTDITGRVKAKQKARMLERMEAIVQVIGGVCHTFNNINHVILGNLLRLEQISDTKGEKYTQKIEDAIQRSAQLNSQLLAYARKGVSKDKVKMSLADRVRYAVHQLQSRCEVSAPIAHVAAANLWNVSANREDVDRMLEILLANAHEAGSDTPKVEIKTSNLEVTEERTRLGVRMERGQYVQLLVTDDGMGMSPAVCRKAFEPFFTTKDPALHKGLGLSNIFGMVSEANGHVQIESKLGRGTEVRLFFPRVGKGPSESDRATKQKSL